MYGPRWISSSFIRPYRPCLKRTVSTRVSNNIPGRPSTTDEIEIFKPFSVPPRALDLNSHNIKSHQPHSISVENHDIDSQKLRRLLSAASFYGIASLEQLGQAAVVDVSGTNGFFSNFPVFRRNLHLWRILFEYAELAQGDHGVRRAWHAMRALGVSSAVKSGEPQAEQLLNIMLTVGKRDEKFLTGLCDVLINEEFDHQALFVEVLSALMSNTNPGLVERMSEKLRFYWARRSDILTIFEAACQAEPSVNSLQHFRTVCDHSNRLPPVKLYSRIIPVLCERDRPKDAFVMHEYLLSCGDLPSGFDDVAPLVREFVIQGQDPGSLIRSLENIGIFYEGQIRKLYGNEKTKVSGYSADSLNIVNSASFGVKPRRLGDKFVARAFATQAFSVDFILSTLRLVGLAEIGPLAMRQLGLRAQNAFQLNQILQQLKLLEVDTDSSTFTRLVRQIAADGNDYLLQQILATDLHHDVFEDMAIQKRLLEVFCKTRNWPQINQTAAIMSMHGPRGDMIERCLNFILERAIKVEDWAGILNIITTMQSNNKKVTIDNLTILRKQLVSSPSGGLSQVYSIQVNQLKFLIGVYQQLLGSGNHIPLLYWRPILVNLCRLGHLEDFSELLLWLVKQYHPSKTNISQPHAAQVVTEGKFNDLIDKAFQRALVHFGFLQHDQPTQQNPSASPQNWWKGIALICKLENLVGLRVHRDAIRKAFIQRMRVIFRAGHGWSARFRNQRLQRANQIDLSQYYSVFKAVLNVTIPEWEPEKPRAIHREVFVQAPRYVRPRTVNFLRRTRNRVKLPIWLGKLAMSSEKDYDMLRLDVSSVTPTEDKQEAQDDDVVVYSDLYTPSWKEYESETLSVRKHLSLSKRKVKT